MKFFLEYFGLKSLLHKSTAIIISPLVIILIVALLLLLSPIFIYRWCVSKYAKRFKHKDLGQILSAISSIMVFGEVYENPKNVIAVQFLQEGIPDLNKIRQLIQTNILDVKNSSDGELMFPELTQNLTSWMGFLFWKPLKEFKLEDHIYFFETSVKSVSMDEVSKLINDLTMKSWSKEKALWEFIIVPNVIKDSSNVPYFVTLFRFHHGLGDGCSVLKFFSRLDFSGNVFKMLKPRPATNSSAGLKLLKDIKFLCEIPYDLALCILTPSGDKDPFKVMGQKVTGRSLEGIMFKIPIKEIKDTKNALGVSFSAVVMNIIIGGIRQMLIETNKELPKRLCFRFPVPLPGHSTKMRNHMSFAAIYVDLQEENSLKRLTCIQKQFDKIKKSTLPMTMSYLTRIGGSLPSALVNYLVNNAVKKQYVNLSNFPGPETQTDLFGYPVKSVYDRISTAGTRVIMFTATTYMADICLQFGADLSVLPSSQHCQKLMEACIREFEVLKKCRFNANFV